MSRGIRTWSAALAAVAVAWAAADARAVPPRDKAALRLDDEAMGRDYLETNFVRAQKKLAQAVGLCGKSSCSTAVVALLHRDLGVVLIGGLSKNAEGKQEFARALEIEPSIELDPDFVTPAMKKIWIELKKKPAGGAPLAHAAEPHVVHTAVTEQRVSTPVPLFATFEGGDPPTRMRVFYKGVGAKIWAHADMKRAGDAFVVNLPCGASARVGELLYFIQAEGADDEVVAQDGTREAPKKVEIKRELEGEPPHLPDSRPPSACAEVSEAARPSNTSTEVRENWFTFLVEQDLALVGSAAGVCDENIQTTGGWSCFRAAGSQYHGNPKSNVGDVVNAGLAPATTRIHLGFDRVLAAGFVVGLHGGVVLRGGGPRPDGASSHAFFPAHLEMRAAYWFGSDVFSTAGFRPFVFASGGAAEVDTSFAVPVAEDRSKPPPVGQIDNPSKQVLAAWREMGTAFAGGGLGAMIALTPGFGFQLDVKYMHFFPTSGNVVAPEAGIAVGF